MWRSLFNCWVFLNDLEDVLSFQNGEDQSLILEKRETIDNVWLFTIRGFLNSADFPVHHIPLGSQRSFEDTPSYCIFVGNRRLPPPMSQR